MSDFLCPICQRPNDPAAQRCWYCQAPLTPVDKPMRNNGSTDWLSGFREEAEQSSEPVDDSLAAEPPANTEETVPDWLVRIRQLEQAEREKQTSETEKPASTSIQENTDIPAWLKEIKAGNSGKKPEAADAEEPFTPEEATPDPKDEPDGDVEEWLSHLAAWKPAAIPEADETTDASKKALERSLWQQFQPLAKPKKEGVTPQPIEIFGNLQENDSPSEESQTQPSSSENDRSLQTSTEDTNNDALADIAPEISTDDISSRLESVVDQSVIEGGNISAAQENPVREIPAQEELPIIVEDEPEVLNTPALNEEPKVDQPFLPDDLPDWLETASLDNSGSPSADETPEELDTEDLLAGIEKASLPTWLQAIRPPSENVFENTDTPITRVSEDKGLLAGIDGALQTVLPAENMRKPVGYGATLKVSDRQKANAALFTHLIEDTLDGEISHEPEVKRGRRSIWRLVLAVVLIGTILAGGSFLDRVAIQPALFPPEVVAAYDAVNALPTDQPILLAADFESAATGELKLTSQILLEHLMRRNLNLASLSINPVGNPILTDLLKHASLSVDGFDLESHFVSLGYLPGGASGLNLLSSQPRAALPNSYDVQSAWNTLYLNQVQSLDDFGAVILFCDQPENARAWVEQVQPELKDTPLIFVVSAQAAPLLQPYFESGQISGILPGLSGSSHYQKMLDQSGASVAHFGAFQASLIIIAAGILLGGLYTLIRPASKTDKEGGKS